MTIFGEEDRGDYWPIRLMASAELALAAHAACMLGLEESRLGSGAHAGQAQSDNKAGVAGLAGASEWRAQQPGNDNVHVGTQAVQSDFKWCMQSAIDHVTMAASSHRSYGHLTLSAKPIVVH